MEIVASSAKVVEAYRITNHQLAESNQKLRRELYDYEHRYNEVNEKFLTERQENKALRDMVRKLKDQMQMITKVMVSVQEQSEKLFERINRPHELAENMMRNYTPRAADVYQRRRTEYPPYVDEAAVPEEDEDEDEDADEQQDADGNGDDDAGIQQAKEPAVEDDQARDANNATRPNEWAQTSSTTTPNRSVNRGSRSFGCELMPAKSPLVQRLKRPSKNSSFDESFETIDRDRVFKVSRSTQSRRGIYTNLQEHVQDDLQTIYNDSNRMVDDALRETLRRISSPVTMDDNDEDGQDDDDERQHTGNRTSSDATDATTPENDPVPSTPTPPSVTYHSRLKKSASESMLLQMHQRGSLKDRDCCDGIGEKSSASHEEIELTVFNPAELVASCSTPLVYREHAAEPEQPKRARRGRPPKTKSETNVQQQLLPHNPIVVIQPLTVHNLQHHEQITVPQKGRRGVRIAKGMLARRQEADSSNSLEEAGGTLQESGSSLENLSVASSDLSYRPRRRTAPKSFREPSLRAKLRRQ